MNRTLNILLLASALFTLAGGLFSPIYAVFVEQIGGNLLDAGGAYAAFSLSAGILVFLISRWEDHTKHMEKFVVLGYMLSCLGYLGLIMVRNPLDLFLVQVVFGIGQAVNLPAYDGLYSKSLDRGKFAYEWGLWESMFLIVSAIAAPIGGFLAQTYGFSLLFTIMLGFSILGLLSSALLIRLRMPRA